MTPLRGGLLVGLWGCLVCAAGAAGCSDEIVTPLGGAGGGSSSSTGEVVKPPDLPRTEAEATLAEKRKACGFDKGAWPAETIGKEIPVYDDIPIDHVIVIVQENRSFDNYFGRLAAQGVYASGDFEPGGDGLSHHDQVDVPPAGWSNPDAMGNPVFPHPDDEHCFQANHGWNDLHDAWDNGKNDHFVTNNDPDGQRVMSYLDDSVIPFYYALADKFAIGDRYFASAMTSTWPNRFFLMAGTSFGIGDNSFALNDVPDNPAPQIMLSLEAAGRTWRDYTDGPHQVLFFPNFGFRSESIANYKNIRCDLMTDIENDTLPDVALVMGDQVSGFSDETPESVPGIGAQMVERIVRKLFASPAWKSTALFITYDENGGMADHVPPEPACEPDDFPAHGEKGKTFEGKFDRTGFRVPFTLVSPYARAHYVSHTVFDHTSITRFIQARFGLPALTARDANATPPFDMFDFASPPNMTPPNITATTTVPPEQLAQCRQTLAPVGCEP
jgi:phospholipase C